MKNQKKKIRLGVNIDHVATLRQVRGGTTIYPSLLDAAEISAKAGAQQITIHLREDRRHIQDKDVELLCKKRPCLINLEMAATDEMLKIALKRKPDWVCFVPEKRQELTTEGGLDVVKLEKKLKKMLESLHKKNIKVSMFIAGDIKQVEASARIGADAVELHTGHWVLWKGDKKRKEWQSLKAAALRTHELGMNVHAGHGLDFIDCERIKKLPYLEELNIGHSIICHSIFMGLNKAVKAFKKQLRH